jgi:ATP/maltotriose-dependent transcriptional regulator MalT
VLRPVVAWLERRGADSAAATARGWLDLAELRLDDLTAADTPIPEGYEQATRAHMLRAEVQLARGDAEGAVAHAREAAAVAATGDWVILEADARMTLARALTAAGDVEAAAAEAEAAARLATAKGYVTTTVPAEALR